MRFVFILLILTTSCSQRTTYQKTPIFVIGSDKYGDITDGLPDKDSHVLLKNESGQVVAEGQCAVYDNTTTVIKVGSWTEYYDNGIIKTKGQYKIGSYIDCCVNGACQAFYFYRFGLWTYFDSKGNADYELEFVPEKLRVDTRCEGGDTLTYGLIKAIPIKYWEKLTTDKVYELQKISFKNTGGTGTTTFTPLNGELHISYSRDK